MYLYKLIHNQMPVQVFCIVFLYKYPKNIKVLGLDTYYNDDNNNF